MGMRAWFGGRPVLLAAFLLFIVLDFFLLHGFAPVEHPLQDALLRLHAAHRTPDPDVVVVNVDEPSLLAAQKELGVGWPWPRAMYADLLQGILKQDPKAVLFDIYFVDPSSRGQEDDAYLVQVATASDKASALRDEIDRLRD